MSISRSNPSSKWTGCDWRSVHTVAANQSWRQLQSEVEFSFSKEGAAGCALLASTASSCQNSDADLLLEDSEVSKAWLAQNVAQVKSQMFSEENRLWAGEMQACSITRKGCKREQEAVFSYRGSSQSRAGIEGRPSPSSSPRILSHGLQPGTPWGGGCLLLVSPSYKVQPAQ